MKNKVVKAVVGDLPHMTLRQADKINSFIERHQFTSILELGFRHGVSTCYMAASLARTGGGSITTVDFKSAQTAYPNIEQLLEKIGERERVHVYYEPTSYTWRLMKMLEESPSPRFDSCYLDGAHNWFVDALAFFLVDRLLEPGGWILFDDLNWTYATSPSLKNTEFVKNMPDEEKETAQVKKIFDLLVRTHPDYGNFRVDGSWAYAQKIKGSNETFCAQIESPDSCSNKLKNFFSK